MKVRYMLGSPVKLLHESHGVEGLPKWTHLQEWCMVEATLQSNGEKSIGKICQAGTISRKLSTQRITISGNYRACFNHDRILRDYTRTTTLSRGGLDRAVGYGRWPKCTD